jgi:hypothetical protein
MARPASARFAKRQQAYQEENMAVHANIVSTPDAPTVVDEQLYCTLTGKPISREEAYWAPPVVTARDLVITVFSTLFRAPGMLGQILFGELPNVPYSQEARELLARQRSAEQLKLLIGLLVVAALIATPLLLALWR